MTYPAAAIRTAVAELLEGTIGSVRTVPAGTFLRGVFPGQPMQSQRAKAIQTSTARHYFDVRLGPLRNNPSTPVGRIGTYELNDLDITITVTSKIAPVNMLTQRDTDLALIASDCKLAVKTLSYPHNLTATDAGVATSIVGGCLLGPEGSTSPTIAAGDERTSPEQLVVTVIQCRAILRVEYSDALSVEAGADSGEWVNGWQTLSGTISGGVEPYVTAWTVQSGGTGEFDSDDSTSAAFAPNAPAAGIVLRMTVTDAEDAVAYDEVTLVCTFDAVVVNGIGFERFWHYQASDSGVTRNGSNLVSQVSDLFEDARHLTQATDGNKLTYDATGGPDGTPCVTATTSNDYAVWTSSDAIPTGTLLYRIAVTKGGASANRIQVQARVLEGILAAGVTLTFMRAPAGGFQLVATEQFGPVATTTVATTPAYANEWVIQTAAWAPAENEEDDAILAWAIDGVATDPQPDMPGGGLLSASIRTIAWGHGSAAGGSAAFDLALNGPTAALQAFIYQHVLQEYPSLA